MSVLAGLVGYLVLQSRRRERARRAEASAIVAVIPPPYRRRREPLWFILLMAALHVAAVVVGSAMWGKVGAAASFGVGAPFLICLILNARDHTRNVIAAVLEEVPKMDREGLGALVEALEFLYGESELKPLRRLLPDSG
jgi:hypothetical protein